MPDINLNVSATLDDYKKNKYINKKLTTNHASLIRHAKTLGNLSSYSLTAKGRLFYSFFIDMVLNKGKLELRNDYLQAETSLMSSYSFFLGMILTKEIAENKYNIANLYHLNDKKVGVNPITVSKGQYKHPDFFGENVKDYFLFESKGRIDYKLSFPEAKNAKTQLKNVDITYNHTYIPNSSIKKHIINSVFEKSTRKINMWDIDPPGEVPKLKLELNKRDLLLDYYRNILFKDGTNELLKDDEEFITRTFERVDYKIIKNETNIFGLQKDVLENLREIFKYTNVDNKNEYLQKLMEQHSEIINENKNKNKNPNKHADTSLGMDGIIFSNYE